MNALLRIGTFRNGLDTFAPCSTLCVFLKKDVVSRWSYYFTLPGWEPLSRGRGWDILACLEKGGLAGRVSILEWIRSYKAWNQKLLEFNFFNSST